LNGLSARLADVRGRLQRAALKAGRDSNDILVVAVTKTHGPEIAAEAFQAGLRDFGENRVQEAEKKIEALRGKLTGHRWHLIGHLQTNKAKKAAALFDVIQSIDSLRLADIVNNECEKLNRSLECLLEVKTSPEPAKQGLLPDEAGAFFDRLSDFPRLRVNGLMTVAPYSDNPEEARPYFRRLRDLAAGRFPVLSMGMSGDFEVAVEEGATMVRLGTVLFGAR